MIRFLHLALLVVLGTGIAAQGWAEPRTRAVLVGVGDYLTLDADLRGPPNDVGLMADMLLRRGVPAQDIQALTDPGAALPDGVAHAAPDRAAILAGFAAAIEASTAGDTVLFYFSGHGTQAPDQDGDEQGGYDELFLPRDAGPWNGAAGEVENAIRDDEFAALARRAAARQVRLVGIIDACHSATGFRAVADAPGQARYLDPARLNIPEAAAAPVGDPAPTPSGDYVFLYAAQADQRAFEYPLGGEVWYGDFTRNLVNVLQEVPDLSYAQLVQAVTLRLQSRSGQVAQTPEIEGSLTDAPVFGGSARLSRRIAVDGPTLMAGILNDITVGSKIALFAGPTEKSPVGYARVRSLRAAEAELELLEPYPEVRVAFGEVVERAMDVSFTLSLAPDAEAALNDMVPEGANALQAALDFPLSDTADMAVVWTGQHFALVGRDRVLDAYGPGTSPRLPVPENSTDPIADLAIALSAHARRNRLEQALAQMSGQVQTGFSLLKSSPDTTVTRLDGTVRGGRCRLTGTRAPIATGDTASHCDGLQIEVTNGSSRMQDVTVLYIDAEAGISMLWPKPNLSNRIPSGESRVIKLGLRNPTDRTLRESLLVLSVPAEPGSARTVLGALADGQMRGEADPMAAGLAGLADPETSARSLSLTPPGGNLNMHRLDLTITPVTDQTTLNGDLK